MTLPLDRSRRFDPSLYPQDPAAYTALDHFIQRFKEPERFLTDEVVRTTIEDGDLRDNGDGCACFRQPWGDGVAYYLIAGHHYDGYRVMVTGWPWVHNREAALDSGRWSNDELDTIEQLNERKKTHFSDEWADYVQWSKAHPDGNTTTPTP